MADVQQLVDTKIGSKKVVVFSKTSCPYCTRVKKLLQSCGLAADEMEVVELDRSPHNAKMAAIQDYLAKKTGGRTVPRVFIDGKFHGGCDDTEASLKNGTLKKKLGKA